MEKASSKIELEDFITQHCFHAVGEQIIASMDIPTLSKCRLLNSTWKTKVDKYFKLWDISAFRLEEYECQYYDEEMRDTIGRICERYPEITVILEWINFQKRSFENIKKFVELWKNHFGPDPEIPRRISYANEYASLPFCFEKGPFRSLFARSTCFFSTFFASSFEMDLKNFDQIIDNHQVDLDRLMAMSMTWVHSFFK